MREGAYDTVRHSSTAQVISPLSCGPAAPPTVRSYLDDQEDVCRGVCDGEDGGAGEGGDGRVGNVGPQQALHLIGVQVKVEILRDLRGEERRGGVRGGGEERGEGTVRTQRRYDLHSPLGETFKLKITSNETNPPKCTGVNGSNSKNKRVKLNTFFFSLTSYRASVPNIGSISISNLEGQPGERETHNEISP